MGNLGEIDKGIGASAEPWLPLRTVRFSAGWSVDVGAGRTSDLCNWRRDASSRLCCGT